MSLTFEKYHGLGNDYLVYDCLKNSVELDADTIRLICNRNFGLGSDGILVGPIMKYDNIGVKIFNPDGSEAEKSGNGVRIFSKYLKDAGYVHDNKLSLHTLGGTVEVEYLNKQGTVMTIAMGTLSFDREKVGYIGIQKEIINVPLIFNEQEYTCTCVSIGNPHCVILMDEISRVKVCDIGKFSEIAEYFPNRINTQIVKVLDRNNIQIEIYERGAGYTLASGSSSCAAAGAVYKLGLADSDICVHMPGGKLNIKIDNDMNVFMTGSVCSVGEMILSDEFVLENNIGIILNAV